MNTNKLLLNNQLMKMEELSLKTMQFATEFMLKKAQYRLLNPLHLQELNSQQVHKQSQLMAELNSYCFKKEYKSIPTKKKISSPNKSQPSGDLKANLSSKKSIQLENKPLNRTQITSDVFLPLMGELKSKVSKEEIKNSTDSKNALIRKDEIKQTPEKPFYNLVFSSQSQSESQRSSNKSNKSKSKFQKIKKVPRQSQNIKKESSFEQPDFKKKKLSLDEKNKLKQSPIEAKNAKQSMFDSDDSFDSTPLGNKPNNTNSAQMRVSFKTQNQEGGSFDLDGCESYHSSIVQSQVKKMEIQVVSQHPSENQISYITQKETPHDKIQINQIDPEKLKHKEILDDKASLSQQSQNSLDISQIERERQQQQILKQNEIEKQRQQQQLNNYLFKLQSLEVQQQILNKKFTKLWNKDFQAIKKVKKIKWEDFKLPKPSFAVQVFQYGKVFQ